MRRAAAIAVALATGTAIAGCKAAPDEPSGIGAWDVVHTTRKDATGRCDATDLPDGRKGTWCYMQQPISVGQPAQVDLYFGGTDDAAPLIELQLKVPACDIDKVESWGRTAFGTPFQHGGGRTLWRNRYLFVALLPAETRCLLRVLPRSEQKEFERITGVTIKP